MSNLICCQPVDVYGFTAGAARLGRRLLPGAAEEAGPIPVDVHVRSYGESLPPAPRVVGPEAGYGRLPVGSILDCYV
ncbi:MAG: hypothetical protein JW741_23230 [Sedimentisphaerales bacterium]|nr:hypothetical protein [Sedimentisphaerales bacterium]